MNGELPYLDLTAPGFSTKGAEVLAARDRHWCARTPFGLAVLRHREAGMLLRDRRLRQGSYAWPDRMELEGSFAEFWKRSVISQEGETHKAQRRIALAALSETYVESLVPEFERIARELAESLEDRACEFIHDFTEPFAGRAITTLLGLPDSEAHWVAADATSLGYAMAVDCIRYQPEFNTACDRLAELARSLLAHARRGADTESVVARMLAAAGDAEAGILEDLVVISIFGGVDTTRAQLGFALALFARHPDQWQLLRNDPELVPQAVDEVIRTWPTTTWSTREALDDFEFGGVRIASGTTLHMLVHSSGTDPLAVPGWQFDITQRRKMHFGFGGGAHHCLGALVARTDMAAALRVLAGKFRTVESAGEPDLQPDSGNTSPNALPLRFRR